MKKNLTFLYAIIIMIGVACSSSTNSPDIDKSLPVITPTEQAQTPATLTTPEAPVTFETNNTQVPQPSAANNVALNPPHGAPGHDCNIAVGSPLNGAANSLNAPPPMPVMPSSVNPVNNASASGIRLNPPHGEPGHDCNIQVGQPLS